MNGQKRNNLVVILFSINSGNIVALGIVDLAEHQRLDHTAAEGNACRLVVSLAKLFRSSHALNFIYHKCSTLRQIMFAFASGAYSEVARVNTIIMVPAPPKVHVWRVAIAETD